MKEREIEKTKKNILPTPFLFLLLLSTTTTTTTTMIIIIVDVGIKLSELMNALTGHILRRQDS
jgi:hypothetical protein